MTNVATVETLTAEVRTLVVGSRQITLSIAKQLDVVPLDELDVMGRIRFGDQERRVIGSNKSGNLAVAYYQDPETFNPAFNPLWVSRQDLPGRITVCRATSRRSGVYMLSLDGVSFNVNEDATEPCDVASHGWRNGMCDGWRAPEPVMTQLYLQLEEAGRKRDKTKTLHEAAERAPLIVLAGLR